MAEGTIVYFVDVFHVSIDYFHDVLNVNVLVVCLYLQALQFFTHLQEFYPPAGVYLCVVYRELDNPDGAMTVLKSCVEEKGHRHAALLLAYGKQLLLTGKIEPAFEMAKKSIGKAQTVCTCILISKSTIIFSERS